VHIPVRLMTDGMEWPYTRRNCASTHVQKAVLGAKPVWASVRIVTGMCTPTWLSRNLDAAITLKQRNGQAESGCQPGISHCYAYDGFPQATCG